MFKDHAAILYTLSIRLPTHIEHNKFSKKFINNIKNDTRGKGDLKLFSQGGVLYKFLILPSTNQAIIGSSPTSPQKRFRIFELALNAVGITFFFKHLYK